MISEVLKVYGSVNVIELCDIVISVLEIVENGVKVEIEIISNIFNSCSLVVFVDKNLMLLCVFLDFFSVVLFYVRL